MKEKVLKYIKENPGEDSIDISLALGVIEGVGSAIMDLKEEGLIENRGMLYAKFFAVDQPIKQQKS